MTKPRRACQIKAGLLTLATLEISEFDLARIDQQLTEICQQAPSFFQQTPIIISLLPITDIIAIDWPTLITLCQQHGLRPIAVRASEPWKEHLLDAPLAYLPHHHTPPSPHSPALIDASEKRLIINKPIRSGQQIYAQDQDLIVLTSVSQGAEVLADGDIHIYGSLRGRALAGVNNDRSAQIFCQSLEAELISIAGHYQNDIKASVWKHSVVIALEQSTLSITPLSTTPKEHIHPAR